MPATPYWKVPETTATAWSDAVPDPKACMIIVALPKRRGMKKSELLCTRRAIQMPSAVMPSRYPTSTMASTTPMAFLR